MRAHQRLTNKQRKAMEEEIKKQCVDVTQNYELDIDTVWIYVIRKKLGHGSKKMQEIYSDMFALRKEMQAFYKGERDDNIAEFAMRYDLKNDGIDVEKMFEDNQNNHRFEVVFK